VSAPYLCCTECHKRFPTHQRLFECLHEFTRKSPDECPTCGAARELHLNLDFQLGVGDGDFRVVSAFLPDRLESWLGEEEEEVTFYPFLVVLHGSDGKQFCWMPYWHVTGKEARYGQHAVCLDVAQFDSLVAQAQEKVLQPL
jgi:hypothetical protein